MEKVNQVQYVIEWTTIPGRVDEFKKLALEAINIATAKSKVIGYRWYFNSDESKCYLLEQYPDTEALLPHLTSVQQILQKLLEISKITRFEVFGNLNSEAAKALAGLGAKNCEYWNGFVR
jgi:quinol monooxygenase YgiN